MIDAFRVISSPSSPLICCVPFRAEPIVRPPGRAISFLAAHCLKSTKADGGENLKSRACKGTKDITILDSDPGIFTLIHFGHFPYCRACANIHSDAGVS